MRVTLLSRRGLSLFYERGSVTASQLLRAITPSNRQALSHVFDYLSRENSLRVEPTPRGTRYVLTRLGRGRVKREAS